MNIFSPSFVLLIVRNIHIVLHFAQMNLEVPALRVCREVVLTLGGEVGSLVLADNIDSIMAKIEKLKAFVPEQDAALEENLCEVFGLQISVYGIRLAACGTCRGFGRFP